MERKARTPITQLADPAALLRAGKRVADYRILHSVLHGRRTQPMTQVELAKLAGVSVGCLQGFESGQRVTRPDKIRLIAAACKMTIDQLFAPDLPASGQTVEDEFTDETLDVARMFDLLHSEIKLAFKQQLVAALELRTDKRVVTYMHRRRARGEVSAPSSGANFPGGVAKNSA